MRLDWRIKVDLLLIIGLARVYSCALVNVAATTVEDVV